MLNAWGRGGFAGTRPGEFDAIGCQLGMKVGRRWQSGNCRKLHSIGESSASAVAVEDLHCVSDIDGRVLFLNWRRQRVSERLGLGRHRARWLRGSWRRRQLPNRISAFLHLRFKTSADARRAEIAYGLAVRGAGGFSPSQRDPVSLAASTKIGRRFRKFEGWRQRWTSLGASGEQDAKSRNQTEIARRGSHRKRKRKSIRGARWQKVAGPLLRNRLVETRRAASHFPGRRALCPA